MPLRLMLLAATLLAGGAGIATAETMPATPPAEAPQAVTPTKGAAPDQPAFASADTAKFDLTQLPATKGIVAQYSLTPRGDVDGLILSDGTQVHLPPGYGVQLAAAVRPGDAVTIHGLRAEARPVVQAAMITDDATGRSVIDSGFAGPPHGPGASRTEMMVIGTVKEALYGPRGEVNGALLADGAQIHLPPPEARRLADLLQPGHKIEARGYGSRTSLGASLAANAIGTPGGKLTDIAAPPPPGGPRASGLEMDAPGMAGPGPVHGHGVPPPPPAAG